MSSKVPPFKDHSDSGSVSVSDKSMPFLQTLRTRVCKNGIVKNSDTRLLAEAFDSDQCWRHMFAAKNLCPPTANQHQQLWDTGPMLVFRWRWFGIGLAMVGIGQGKGARNVKCILYSIHSFMNMSFKLGHTGNIKENPLSKQVGENVEFGCTGNND